MFILYFFYCTAMAQTNSTPFYKIRYDSFVYGDMAIIGNSIVNRTGTFVSPNTNYDDLGESAKHNDQFDMRYIDIDSDGKTFSSSSAYLTLPKGITQIVYAGLYWVATYPYNEGSTRDLVVYKEEDPKREVFDKVLLKLPGVSDYKAIFGKVLFDGANNPDFRETKPYVAYADITEWLQFLQRAEGEYTVASIRSAQGQISGGISAGWTMIVIYEKSGSPLKKITTYDGFEEIYKKDLLIDFKGFKTPSDGRVSATLGGSVFEADYGIKGSRISVEAPKGRELYLRTKTRDVDNFFNGTITSADTLNLKRNPASKNTLGYDIFIMPVPNTSNLVLGNDVDSFRVKLPMSQDRYFTFLTAFSVMTQSVAPQRYEEVEEIDKNVVLNELISNEINKGYYNIVGTFTTIEAANRYRDKLDMKGFYSRILEDDEKHKFYIYIDISDKLRDAMDKQTQLKKYDIFESTWILSVKNKK